MRWALLFLFAACGGGSSVTPDGGQPIDAGSETRAPMDAGCFASVPTGPLEVTIEQGTIRGMFDGDARVFLGIPYAAPPKRWIPADPPNCFHALFQANAFGEECTQIDRSGNVAGSEDCLTLNVWAPKTPGPHAVMVWIHGGDNIIGSAQDYFSDVPVYDGKALAEREDVIVVTIQYRLGAFGFLQHASFADARGIIGNFGTLDQITALGWVKRNIAAFGGDPAKVTIFGQSAGGDAVCALLASPMSAGLFSGAILHSGACHINSPDVTQASAKAVMSKLGCTQGDVAACMRSKTNTSRSSISSSPNRSRANRTSRRT